LCICNK